MTVPKGIYRKTIATVTTFPSGLRLRFTDGTGLRINAAWEWLPALKPKQPKQPKRWRPLVDEYAAACIARPRYLSAFHAAWPLVFSAFADPKIRHALLYGTGDGTRATWINVVAKARGVRRIAPKTLRMCLALACYYRLLTETATPRGLRAFRPTTSDVWPANVYTQCAAEQHRYLVAITPHAEPRTAPPVRRG